MRLNWRLPLPGPLSISGHVGGRSRRRRSSTAGGPGCIAGTFMLFGYLLLGELWLAWWTFKPLYIAGVLIHRRVTRRNTPIWRSRNGWW